MIIHRFVRHNRISCQICEPLCKKGKQNLLLIFLCVNNKDMQVKETLLVLCCFLGRSVKQVQWKYDHQRVV